MNLVQHSVLEPAGPHAALIRDALWHPMYAVAAVTFVLVVGGARLGGAPSTRHGPATGRHAAGGSPRTRRRCRHARDDRGAVRDPGAVEHDGSGDHRDAGPRGAAGARDGTSVVVGGPVPGFAPAALGHHRERDPHPRRPAGRRGAGLDRRHPQLLAAEPERQARSDSRPGEQPLAAGRLRRRVSWPVRRVLRAPARQDGISRGRRAARQLRAVADAAARHGRNAHRQPRGPRPGGVPRRELSDVPRHRRHAGGQPGRSRSHASGGQAHDRGRHAAEHARESGGLDRRTRRRSSPASRCRPTR